MTIIEKLNRLSEMQAQLDVLRLKYHEIRAALIPVIPAEIQKQLDDLDTEWQPAFDAISSGIAELEAEIKAEVEAAGESVKGNYLHAIYTAGRVTWDGKLLEGYSVAHPELLQARKVGKPSVSIRGVK